MNENQVTRIVCASGSIRIINTPTIFNIPATAPEWLKQAFVGYVFSVEAVCFEFEEGKNYYEVPQSLAILIIGSDRAKAWFAENGFPEEISHSACFKFDLKDCAIVHDLPLKFAKPHPVMHAPYFNHKLPAEAGVLDMSKNEFAQHS